MNLDHLQTEKRNQKTVWIDTMDTETLIQTINEEDTLVTNAIAKVLPQITAVVDQIVHSLESNGRLIYIGAGTSGRIGVLDASECPPTYGTSPDLVIGLIAGGRKALTDAVEGAEDNKELAVEDLQAIHLQKSDILIGIAASGRTPYTISAIEHANKIGCQTVAVVCTKESPMEQVADFTIAPITGAEVVTGSTRMKAGSAQKMVLNMLSTATMIKLGKVFSNLMVDVQATNEKLVQRAKQIAIDATGSTEKEVEEALIEQNFNTKTTIFQLLSGIKGKEAKAFLDKHNGHLRKALEMIHSSY
jgi:N-acetylmuramic acid 6-phosphate etherase